ncbi:hypothetical protein Tco_0004492 [Tanacetum coccineum]
MQNKLIGRDTDDESEELNWKHIICTWHNFKRKIEHPEQPKSSNDIYLMEQGDSNITIDSSDIAFLCTSSSIYNSAEFKVTKLGDSTSFQVWNYRDNFTSGSQRLADRDTSWESSLYTSLSMIGKYSACEIRIVADL